jgi:hypothetical protein
MAKRSKMDWDDGDDGDDAAAPIITCWLCTRPMGAVTEWHHPIPKSRGGKAREPVHPICHRTIHANFTNSELERSFNTADAMSGNIVIKGFMDWIANKPPDFDAPTKKGR